MISKDDILKLQAPLDKIGISTSQLYQLTPKIVPYLILDGHRTGVEKTGVHGYKEGALFSLRLARQLKLLGYRKVAFLIHTKRNRKTPERMKAIFQAIKEIFDDFIELANQYDIRLIYHGEGIYTTYELRTEILKAEWETQHNAGIEVHYITNYSEEWAIKNPERLFHIPEINVAARFTKGHLSGAYIPSRMQKSAFIYVQNASVSSRWTNVQMQTLGLIIARAYLDNQGYIGSKIYKESERDVIRRKREEELFQENIVAFEDPTARPKKAIIFNPLGPVSFIF